MILKNKVIIMKKYYLYLKKIRLIIKEKGNKHMKDYWHRKLRKELKN